MPGYDDPDDKRNGPVHHTGKQCVENGCSNPAGTAWSPFWCFECNVKRINKITAQLDQISAELEEKRRASA